MAMATSTGLEAFDRTIHHANAWLSDLTAELGEDRRMAYRMLRAFLHLLRDRLTIEEGAHLAAQLPHLWRGVFYEGWVPSRTPDRLRDRESFLERFAVEAQLTGATEASIGAEACARVLRAHIDEGEFRHILGLLPSGLLPLFGGERPAREVPRRDGSEPRG